MKIKSIQFINLIQLAGEPIRHLLVDSPAIQKVNLKDEGVEIVRKGRLFFIPQHNICAVEYVYVETTTGTSETKSVNKGKRKRKK